MMNALWVFIGGGLGSLARYGASGLVARVWGESFPWGTLAVNVSGSFLIGLFAALTGPDGRFWVSSEARTFVAFGLFGGFTTFSSFSLQTLNLMREGQWGWAGANAGLSLALCLGGVVVGHWLGMYLNHKGV